MRDIGDDPGRHFCRLQYKINLGGGDGASRHAVVLCGSGGLHHGHAAFAFDGLQSLGSVAAGARKNDADGAFALVLSQGPEEEIDGQAETARGGGCHQLKGAVQKGHVTARRDNIGAVWLDFHPVDHFKNLHSRVAPDQVGKEAFMVRGQMLDKHKGHVRIDIGGHAGEERFKGLQPAG